MDPAVSKLIEDVWEKFETWPNDRRFMIAIGGIPGSGKTSLSKRVTDRLNAEWAEKHKASTPIAAFLPMDGFHYPREVLTKWDTEDASKPEGQRRNAHARRGAEFTFDGSAYYAIIEQLEKVTAETHTISAPGFDHEKKDPEDDEHQIQPTQQIVVIEGNYLLLDKDPWNKAAEKMALRWFVQVEDDVARERLAPRHVAAKIVKTLEEGFKRADSNDLINGKEINENKVSNIDAVIESKEDALWKPK